jgi:hypothetical protein
MTQATWHRAERHATRPSGWMRAPSDAADLVTADAQRLACPVVTARARGRIATRLAAVLVVEPDPSGWMRAAASVTGDAAIYVARSAAIR